MYSFARDRTCKEKANRIHRGIPAIIPSYAVNREMRDCIEHELRRLRQFKRESGVNNYKLSTKMQQILASLSHIASSPPVTLNNVKARKNQVPRKLNTNAPRTPTQTNQSKKKLWTPANAQKVARQTAQKYIEAQRGKPKGAFAVRRVNPNTIYR